VKTFSSIKKKLEFVLLLLINDAKIRVRDMTFEILLFMALVVVF
jgi:hypothetical protein